jgi:hypothetical protein
MSRAAGSSAIPTRVQQARVLTAAELAWIAAIPCAIVTLAAILVLGPVVGHALFPPSADRLWPPDGPQTIGRHEPVKFGRYLLAAVAPVLLASVVLVAGRRELRLQARRVQALTLTSQALVLAVLALGVLGQRGVVHAEHLFGVGTLLAAAGIALSGVTALRSARVAGWIERVARDSPRRRAACFAFATIAAATWLLDGLVTDGIDNNTLVWTVNDAFAVLDGRTPLVDLHSIYAKLLPYAGAVTMAAFGQTALVYTITMAVLSTLALLGVYAVFRRIVVSSPLALGLFVPFVALSDVAHPMMYNALFPMRYGGAYLMVWLTARRIDRRNTSSAWPLFAVGGLVVVNELEFGTAALAATLVALVCAGPPRAGRDAVRLAVDVVGGILVALAAVSLFTLLRAGALPDPDVLLEWPRIFTGLGWFSLPMPAASLHLAIYATFAATIAVAAVRMLRADRDILLTSMLAWGGVFGLLAGSYYVGRPDHLKLVSMFSAWGFALALLTIVSVRSLAARRWRRPAFGELLVLFGFALALCSIVRVTPPQKQIARLVDEPAPAYQPAARRFVGGLTHRGEKVAILLPLGHRFAYELGLDNVFPYTTQDDLVTRGQWQRIIDSIRREHVHTIFLLASITVPAQMAVLQAVGFTARAQEEQFVELADD